MVNRALIPKVPPHFHGEMKIWDTDGLVSRSISIHIPVNRKYSREDTDIIQLHCVSALPGVPVAPQTTTRTFSIKSRTTPTVNNQKLHWLDVSSRAIGLSNGKFLLVLLPMLTTVRWRIHARNILYY